jgi:hypothetical protein
MGIFSRGKQALDELSNQVNAALELLDSDTADEIIGEQSEEYQALIQATNAIMAMQWAMMKHHGLRETKASLKRGAQGLSIVLTIVHYAYALGVQRGREDRDDG